MSYDPHGDPPELSREQERAIEVAEKEAERAFDAGDADCAAWLAKWAIDGDEDVALLVRIFLRHGDYCPVDAPPDERKGFRADLLALRARLYATWIDHAREHALLELADLPRRIAEEKAEQKYDDDRIHGKETP